MLKRMLYALALAALLAGSVVAAERTTAQTGLWSVDATWVYETPPSPGDKVNVGEGHTLTMDVDWTIADSKELGVGKNAVLIINDGQTLTMEYHLTNDIEGTGAVTNNGNIVVAVSSDIDANLTNNGTLTLNAAVDFGPPVANSCTIVVAAGVTQVTDIVLTNTGVLDLSAAGAILEMVGAQGAVLQGDGGEVRLSSTSYCSGPVNVTNCTWTAAVGATWDVDSASTLNLGTTTANNLAVAVTADVTIGDSFRCYRFSGTGGVITGADKAITVGGGGLTRTAGDLDAAGTLNVTFAEDTPTFVWASSTKPLGTVTLGDGADVTLSGSAYLQKLSGGVTATLDVDTSALRFKGATANLWDFDGACTGTTGGVHFYGLSANVTNAKLVDVGSADFAVWQAAHTATLSAGLVCDNLVVCGYGSGTGTLTLGGPLTVATNVTLGEAISNTNGILTMAAGDGRDPPLDEPLPLARGFHTVAAAGTGTGHELNLAGNVKPGDNWTFAGFGTVDFGSAVIEASGDLAIDGTSAGTISNTDGIVFSNANTVTVQNVNYATTSAPLICVSCVDGGSNGAGVEFQVPQRGMMGVGF